MTRFREYGVGTGITVTSSRIQSRTGQNITSRPRLEYESDVHPSKCIDTASQQRQRGVIVFFLQIDTLAPSNSMSDKHLQNSLFRAPRTFGAD